MKVEISKIQESRIGELDLDNLRFGSLYSDHMFMADYQDGEWGKHRIVPFQDLKVSPAIMGLHYAISVFEGLKAYCSPKGDILIFRPLENSKRMVSGAERLCIPPFPEQDFLEAVEGLVKLDSRWVPRRKDQALYIRPITIASEPSIGLRPPTRFLFYIICSPVGKYYLKPLRVKFELKFSRASEGGVGSVKTGANYAASMFPVLLAQKKGYDQLIWTDSASHEILEESGTMNLMFVIDDTLVTPALRDTLLSGVTRNSLLTLARDKGIKVQERSVTVKEIFEGLKAGKVQEAFGTGTAATVAPIQTVSVGEEDFELRPWDTWKFGPELKESLESIKYGISPDPYNWNFKVQV